MLIENKLADLILRSGDDNPNSVTTDANIMALVSMTIFMPLNDLCPPFTFLVAVNRNVT